MNSIQDKINLIKQSIEDKTGKKWDVVVRTKDVQFGIPKEKISPAIIGNPISVEYTIPKSFLNLLPLSLPNKEGWIAVEEVARLKYELYRALEALAHMYNQYCPPPVGHAFMSAGENADDVLLYHGLTMNDDGQSSEVNWDKLEEIRLSSPPVKIKE